MRPPAAGTVKPATVLSLASVWPDTGPRDGQEGWAQANHRHDFRPELRGPVRSLGATLAGSLYRAPPKGGYALRLTEANARQQKRRPRDHRFDFVITTALVPGRPAPKTVTPMRMLGMKAASVWSTCRRERGGNCETDRAGRPCVVPDVHDRLSAERPATMPEHAQ